MTAVVGLVMMAVAFFVAVRLTRESRLAHRAGAALAAGTGVLLVLADTIRPGLMPLAVGALCVCLLWLALTPPVEHWRPVRADDDEGVR